MARYRYRAKGILGSPTWAKPTQSRPNGMVLVPCQGYPRGANLTTSGLSRHPPPVLPPPPGAKGVASPGMLGMRRLGASQVGTDANGVAGCRARRLRQRLGEPISGHLRAGEEVQSNLPTRLVVTHHVVSHGHVLGAARRLRVVDQGKTRLVVLPHRHSPAIDPKR